jgi:hypothetical protein
MLRQRSNSCSRNNRRTIGSGVFCWVQPEIYPEGLLGKRTRLEYAVSCSERDPSEVVADSRPCRRRGWRRNPRCCKPLRSSAELVVGQSSASKDMKAERSMALEIVTGQPVKIEQTGKT